jgi:hypothetical protein
MYFLNRNFILNTLRVSQAHTGWIKDEAEIDGPRKFDVA